MISTYVLFTNTILPIPPLHFNLSKGEGRRHLQEQMSETRTERQRGTPDGGGIQPPAGGCSKAFAGAMVGFM